MAQEWVRHALRSRTWRMQRQAVALGALGVVLAIIISALYLAQAASVATLGRQLENLIVVRNQLEQTNEGLRAEIAQLRSVPRLLARAHELGFVIARRENIEYLVVSGYNPNPPPPQPPAVEKPRPVYDESFTGWLRQQLDWFSSQFQSFVGAGGP